MNEFTSYLDTLSARHGRERVFPDFLTIVVCCLSLGTQEDLYFKTIERYDKQDLEVFTQAFAALVIEMNNGGEGLHDVLGCYFEEYFYNQKLGQFFTPPSICSLMASFVNPDSDTCDPCCGSGRFFLEIAKKNRDITFYGADISEVCCKMTLINLCLNRLKCRISWMDSISLEVWAEWAVLIHPVYRVPYIVKIERENVVIEEIVPERKMKFRKFRA